MRELPVLFNGQMVRAILEGRKTQTRRPLRNQPEGNRFILSRKQGRKIVANIKDGLITWIPYGGAPEQPMPMEEIVKYLPYAVGDRMYVREAFQVYSYCQSEYGGQGEAGYPLERVGKNAPEQSYTIFYRADGQEDGPWRPSIHMPKWAARIWLEVTGVRVERLQDISEADVWREGLDENQYYEWLDDVANVGCGQAETPKQMFGGLWDAQYGKTKYAWANNPWVSVTEFQRAKD